MNNSTWKLTSLNSGLSRVTPNYPQGPMLDCKLCEDSSCACLVHCCIPTLHNASYIVGAQYMFVEAPPEINFLLFLCKFNNSLKIFIQHYIYDNTLYV